MMSLLAVMLVASACQSTTEFEVNTDLEVFGDGTVGPRATISGTTDTTSAPSTTTMTGHVEPDVEALGEGESEFVGTVIGPPDQDPVLCSGGVASSYPPQCDGTPIDGLDWADVSWAKEASGTHWAAMAVIGVLENGRLTLTRPPQPPPAGIKEVP